MNTIRKKIIWLSLGSWIVMAGVWLSLSIYNQQTIEAYNTILQRYIFMNEISKLSSNSVALVNRFMDERQESQLGAYAKIRQQLMEDESKLGSLTNPNNEVALVNYGNMIRSQFEAMEQTIVNVRMDDRETAQEHFDEATNISKYISEATLALLSTELRTYNVFYESMIERSRDLQKMGFWGAGDGFLHFAIVLIPVCERHYPADFGVVAGGEENFLRQLRRPHRDRNER